MLEQLVSTGGSSGLHATDDFQLTVFSFGFAATCRYRWTQVDSVFF